MAFIERNGILRHNTALGQKNQVKQPYRFLLEVHTRPLRKKNEPNWKILDLTKAYDVLNHEVLLSKLNSYGIRGVANLRFESYLSRHKQCVEIHSMKQGMYVLTKREIEHGVPQD
jgi:hypothetical protein